MKHGRLYSNSIALACLVALILCLLYFLFVYVPADQKRRSIEGIREQPALLTQNHLRSVIPAYDLPTITLATVGAAPRT